MIKGELFSLNQTVDMVFSYQFMPACSVSSTQHSYYTKKSFPFSESKKSLKFSFRGYLKLPENCIQLMLSICKQSIASDESLAKKGFDLQFHKAKFFEKCMVKWEVGKRER